ncbi:CDP-glycerol:poly(glycerophosphate) glycerophosphotransferase [Oxobacter pfennigii]|uniref:CDP-glycerol:poly(Glycerophosphate) glycerophosphotransferase n=1 Tax=Oxobacter pfennigii TaxID=36849 RepID=A0A0P8YC26_9CLOT|nr:CDP-glycerol glycerophosphotransferase family protein [Oxobacter pfennigii]KPU44669.1 CDP-glycerol:poly(glycerophosphate) glycerophosphotransferase [Oxobacter pfennigii]
MRKYHQQQILELLRTIKEAQRSGLYEDCKEGASAVCNFIEKMEGKGTQTVVLLQEYCELLFKANNRRIGEDVLHKYLKKIESYVRDELKPNKIEVVFFPYQLSMWDSFESIYLTAKSDPSCNAYCVPIPWFEKNADGTVFAAHYDGDKYPSNIEVIDWRKYDVAARHPEVIFIHNPYDGNNYVTTVHPNYYSNRLKDFTDLLVYISYGVSYNHLSNPQKYTDPEKRIILPFYLNCDLMLFHQREQAERTKYILSTDLRCKNIQYRQPQEERAVALGSPKFDKVISTIRENCVLPDDWATLINDKKILLFCTSLSSMLNLKNGGEKYLDKLRTTFKALTNRDDIALWWRPHPLMSSTFRSMRRSLLDNYLEIENEFKENKIGVFDDTPDLHRAIAWSDGLLTDKSSIMFMYLATGKPFSINAVDCALDNPKHSNSVTFDEQLSQRIKNMKFAKGANVHNTPFCIWWDNFSEEDMVNNTHFDNFLDNFIHYITHTEEYPESEEYRLLQLQIYEDFVVNPDGTAGYEIYNYCKKKTLGG